MEQLSFKQVATEFLRLFTIAIKNISLYTEYHPLGKSSLSRCYEALSKILKDRNEFTISTADDRMLADESIIDEEKLLMSSIARELTAKGIFSITFRRGASRGDLKAFIDIFMLRKDQLKERGGLSKALEAGGLSFIQANAIKYAKVSESQEILDIALAEHIITGIKPLMTQGHATPETPSSGKTASHSGSALFAGSTSGAEGGVSFDEIMNDPLKISLLFARTLQNFQAQGTAGIVREADVLMALEKLGSRLQEEAKGDWNKLKLVFAQLIMSLKPEIQHLLVEKSSSGTAKTTILQNILTYMPGEKLGEMVVSQYLAGLKDPKSLADFILKILPADNRRETTFSKINEKLRSAGIPPEEIEKINEEVNWLQNTFDQRISTLLAGDKIWLRPFPAIMEVIEEANRQELKNEAMLLIQKYMSGLIHPSPRFRKSVIENAIPLFVFMKEQKSFASQRIKIQNLLFRRLKDENEIEPFEAIIRTISATAIAEIDAGNYSEAIPVLEKLRASETESFSEDWMRKGMISAEISKLETEDFLNKMLEDHFSSRSGAEQNLPKLLEIFGDYTIKFLIEKIASENNRKKRYKLSLIIKSLREKALPALIKCLEDQKWFLVRNAILLIGDIGDHSSVRFLREPLSHDDHRVRREAVRALMKLGGEESSDMIASALDDTDASVVIAAMEALSNVKNTKAIFKMIRILSKSNGYENAEDILRRTAIENLSKLRIREAVPELIKILMKKSFLGMAESAEMRLEAVKALGSIGGDDAMKALVDASEKDPLSQIREVASSLIAGKTHDDH